MRGRSLARRQPVICRDLKRMFITKRSGGISEKGFHDHGRLANGNRFRAVVIHGFQGISSVITEEHLFWADQANSSITAFNVFRSLYL